ncbi:MAG TPA: type II toxin-antitoxin system HicA family toxin [Spirochaetia bacterium]|nr:type II toxin-antitoxin system HicA family toxin [Spirochaetia bacterium]
MKQYSSREVMQILIADGWKLVRTAGSHHQFTHPTKKGTVTVPHPKKMIPVKTARSIFSQAGIKI